METFCKNFVNKSWLKDDDGYYAFVSALPYCLARSKYLNIFDELTKEIKYIKLQGVAIKFEKISQNLLYDCSKEEKAKAIVIKEMIEESCL